MSNKFNSKSILFIGLFVISFGFMHCGNGNEASAKQPDNSKAAPEAVNNSKYATAPDFDLQDLEGNTVKLSDLKGKVVFVNFWATWCPPCRREIPHFIELRDELGDQGFEILGIAIDPREFNSVAPFVKKTGMNYPVMLDKKDVTKLYGGIVSIPTTFVVNREGKIVEKIVGSRSKAEFKQIITAHL